MKCKLLSGIVAGFLMVGGLVGVSQAALVTLVDQGSLWEYAILSDDLGAQWSSVNYNTFDWANASWSTGNAAFGNINPFSTLGTYWFEEMDLALQKSFTIDGVLSGPLTLNLAVDNGFIMFVNGNQEVARDNAGGFTDYWEYTYSLPSSYFQTGTNIIQLFAEDAGWTTFFDLKLTGNVNPLDTVPPVETVPEPATLLLLGTGMLGMIGFGKKKFLR